MKQLTIKASSRSSDGSSASGRLRKEGKVPAVAYGKSKSPTNLTVEAKDLRVLLRAIGNNTPIVMLQEGEGESRTSLIQEVQRNPITDAYVHVDFRAIADDELVDLPVPVHPIGEAYGVKTESGTLEFVSHTAHIRALPKNIPSYIEADVTALKVGESLHIKNLPAIEGVVYTDHAEQPVFTVIK